MNWVNIGSGNGLLPAQQQAITWTNANYMDFYGLYDGSTIHFFQSTCENWKAHLDFHGRVDLVADF